MLDLVEIGVYPTQRCCRLQGVAAHAVKRHVWAARHFLRWRAQYGTLEERRMGVASLVAKGSLRRKSGGSKRMIWQCCLCIRTRDGLDDLRPKARQVHWMLGLGTAGLVWLTAERAALACRSVTGRARGACAACSRCSRDHRTFVLSLGFISATQQLLRWATEAARCSMPNVQQSLSRQRDTNL
jgi:hypothetical protein